MKKNRKKTKLTERVCNNFEAGTFYLMMTGVEIYFNNRMIKDKYFMHINLSEFTCSKTAKQH